MTSVSKVWRRGIPFSPEVAAFVRHMPLVDEHRESLLRLQAVWDSLALMGQMSGSAADISKTRSAFESLTNRLLDSLARRLLDSAFHLLEGKAQVVVDILVRNLFERTADVGFLAADAPVRAIIAAGGLDDEQRLALEARFRAYVAKYSVYDDIVVLSEQGDVLARLDSSVADRNSVDAVLAQALSPGRAYVESYGPTDILGGRSGLIYASAISTAEGPAGVLCLSFKLDDEMRGVFSQLLRPGEKTALVLMDEIGTIIISSDPWQLPAGARLQFDVPSQSRGRLVFAGREYLAVKTGATGYEGYFGPGWSALALLPLDQAFEVGASAAIDARTDVALIDTQDLFDAELQGIPVEAQRIQRELSRSLWNGKLHSRLQRSADSFATTLLDEVERTGQRLREVFEQAIAHLQHSAMSSIYSEVELHARLAIDIMDRNLYERANDCRWWALDAELQQVLSGGAVATAAARLKHINSLYTVYSLLLVFDRDGRIVAVSDPARQDLLGRQIDQPWVAATLATGDRERYVVSRHEACGLYGQDGALPTYVYSASLPDIQDGHSVCGGVALVFDGAPQFEAMLKASLPSGGRAQALFVQRDGRIVASSDPRWQVGSSAPLSASLLDIDAGNSVSEELEIDGEVYALGLAMSGGYREYRRNAPRSPQDVLAVILMPLGPRLALASRVTEPFKPADVPARSAQGEPADMLEIASFLVDGQWLGLPAQQVLEALERPRVTGIPNAPADVAGMLSYREEMLPVLDLGQAYYGRPCVEAEAPVLVCQTRAGRRLAVRVQELGQVFGVSAQNVKPSPAVGAGLPLRRERLVRGAVAGSMLTVLDVDALWPGQGSAGSAIDLLEF